MNWVNGGLANIDDKPAHGAPTIDEVVDYYCELTGRTGLPDLNWYFSYNTFRLAGILQGILGRVRDGTANSPNALATAERMPGLAKAAWEFAVKAGA
jgi:aminoglycoside phosphotransferase (APT) family kinase protein